MIDRRTNVISAIRSKIKLYSEDIQENPEVLIRIAQELLKYYNLAKDKQERKGRKKEREKVI
ncbi:hypothetical protein [Mycoplasmopsis felis]|uniref:hypothetical protein n=1 Tax=Mycoplasmopsis felis TaxID=33923 RepID=UPI002AFE87E3|nr:hypothetical protein [Mycoplasmopsis felis]WQQ10465.1 hypothetical protein RRG49_01880 [Mycoplasmopsis felis]